MTWRRAIFILAVFGGVVAHSWAWLAVFLSAAWLVCAWRWPFAPCWSCQGRKTNRGSTKRRFGKCRRCDGTGSRQVLGSKTVHRAIRSARKYRSNHREK